jgi:Cu/Ag efflux pump CusA
MNAIPPSPAPTFIERVIEVSAQNRFLIFILLLFGVAGGIWSLQHTPLDAARPIWSRIRSLIRSPRVSSPHRK